MHAQESVAALGSVSPNQPDEFPEDQPAPETTAHLRILILNGDLPIFPGWGGVEHLHTTRMAHFADRVGLVSLVHTPEQAKGKHGLADAGVALYLWENPNMAAVLSTRGPRQGLVRRVGRTLYDMAQAFPGRPHDTLVQDMQFCTIAGPLMSALKDESWNVLIVVQSNCSRWLDYLPRFPLSVLVLHDVRALAYERKAQAATSLRHRIVSSLQALLYRRFERRYCQAYDLVITVSPADEAWVRQNYSPARVNTIPIPVDKEYFMPMPYIHEAPARVVFTGMMNHPPNVDAACFFAQDVWPRVRAIFPEAEFWVVGRDPAPEVQALVRIPGVTVTGFVADIRPHIAQATVIVVPLRFGSGMRQKILEAWAMQKCIVSTQIGAEGLDYKDGGNILIADDAETIGARVIAALRDTRLREGICARGREVVVTQHDPDTLACGYYNAIAAVARERGRGPMRAVIDLRWMRPGLAGGIENLSRAFLRHLWEVDAFNQYTVLVPAEAKYDFDLRGHQNLKVEAMDGPAVLLRRLAWQASRFLYGRLRVPYWRSPDVETLRRARALDAQVALSIPGYIHPDLYPLANVLVMPDVQHEYIPEFFSPGALYERRRLYRDAAGRARHICAISEFTRQTLVERLRVPPQRVTTTHLAADPIFHPGSEARRNGAQVLGKYQLRPGQYLFFPGHTWHHKNHRVAFQALRILREEHHLDPLLVCTGAAREAQGELRQLMRDLRLDGRVRFLGYCPTRDMPGLYEGAAALVFPSLFEGFGMPVVEAMWCDCPVVCSNTTSLPEIAGDAALLVDPQSPEDLAEALRRVLTDQNLRDMLIARGRQQRTCFSWRTFTLETVRLLHQACEQA